MIVDEYDVPVDAIRRDDLFRRRGIHFRTAHVFIFDRRGRLLLQRLASRRDRNPLRWGSSVAAYVRPHESYREAAMRRSREELGLKLTLAEVGKTQMPDLGSQKHITLFSGELAAERPEILEPEHIAQIEWFGLKELRASVQSRPKHFTETFLWLFERFLGDGELRAATA